MLDIRRLRAHPDEAESRLASRGAAGLVEGVLRLDARHRELLAEAEGLRARQNALSHEISRRHKGRLPVDEVMADARACAHDLAGLEPRVRQAEEELRQALLQIPNLPDPAVPAGIDESANVVVRSWGEPAQGEWLRPHWEIGPALGILDFERAARMSGARFYALVGLGAALQRALVQLMLAEATETHGFTEVAPPLLVNAEAMAGTGQLPRFEEELFKTREGLYLLPTGEVPLVNLHREEDLDEAALPIRYAACTPCFREETGSGRKEGRGMLRVHQFEKVELVSFARPEDSAGELERLTAAAEGVLRRLGIPGRVMELCAGELGFSAARTYDVEAWFPALGRFLEVSSCSNCADFQARRANIRIRAAGRRPRFPHTLNASALAVGRTLAAILENCQQEDGSVVVPEVLRGYLGGRELIA